LTVTTSPIGAGSIRVNSIKPDAESWTGVYFTGVPIDIVALPKQGFRFTGWSGGNLSAAEAASHGLTLELSGPLSLTAQFEPDAKAVNAVIINEINYHSADPFDPGDWVELYNAYDLSVDVSGWVFKDGEFEHSFVIPEGTALPPGGYLVLGQDVDAFSTAFPAVTRFVGGFNFGLNNGGETLRLLDARGEVVDSVSYDDQTPWPTEPDGNGPTLSLINPRLENTLPTSWRSSRASHGTPGEANDVEEIAAPVLTDARIVSGGELEFLLQGVRDKEYSIQTSADLVTWQEWREILSASEQTRVIAPIPSNDQLLFYRAVLVGASPP